LRLLFVCTGNICRSPTAEAVTRALFERAAMVGRFELESAGLGGWHLGDPPDPRAIRRAALRSYDLTGQRARQIAPQDYRDFDLLLAIDRGHLRAMRRACPPDHAEKIKLFMAFAEGAEAGDVPDPYYGESADFDLVLDLVEGGAHALVAALSHSGAGGAGPAR